LDRIFNTVAVCRSFRLNGLSEILKSVKLNIKPVSLIWQVGDLSAQGYFDTSVASFIVDRDKAKEAIKTLNDPSLLELHKKWRDWYYAEFQRYFKPDDLAELLYHEAAILPEEPSRIEKLIAKTVEYLWEYYDAVVEKQKFDLEKSIEFEKKDVLTFKDAFALLSKLCDKSDNDEKYEIQQYSMNLRKFIEEFNRFVGKEDDKGVLLEEEYKKFCDFIASL